MVGPPPTEEERIALSRARSRVLQARNNFESRRYDFVGAPLDEALAILVPVLSAEADPLRAEIDEIRAQLDAALLEEQWRTRTAELERLLAIVAGNTRNRGNAAPDALAQAEARLASPDFAAYPAPERARMTARIAELRDELAAVATGDAVARAVIPLQQLEGVLDGDPAELVAQMRARDIDDAEDRLRTICARVVQALAPALASAPEVLAVRTRLRASEKRIDRITAGWGTGARATVVFSGWPAIAAAIAGWETEESHDTSVLASPDLPRTRMAVARLGALLASDVVVQVRAENPAADQAYAGLEQIFDAVAVKLHAAFDRAAAAAEELPAPLDPLGRSAAARLAADAQLALAGTPYAGPDTARLVALAVRWRDEADLVTVQQRVLCDRLTREADAAWPQIRARLSPQPFPQAPGATIELRGYNRAGWDYGGPEHPIDFALRIDGYPVALTYAPHVRNVLDHAAYYDKVELPARTPWELIAVVEGPGEVGQRTRVTFVDEATNLPLAAYEQWLPVPCIRAYVIALRAGPVAVAPPAVI
ncbi:MAG TPA: hypothetical protein VGM88_15605 [Kofleriaceae bacterium]|jgi:hypothetical protein